MNTGGWPGSELRIIDGHLAIYTGGGGEIYIKAAYHAGELLPAPGGSRRCVSPR